MIRFMERQKQIFLCVLLGLFLWSCGEKKHEQVSEAPKVIKWDGLEAVINKKSEKLQVINFWATWCAPCIKELPYFEEVNKTAGDKVDVTLVSLDFADEFEKRVLPFIEKRGLQSQVLLLDEIDYNSWIDKVDPSWSGAIPATLIINPSNGKRKFLEKELNEGELNSLIEEILN
ncbi:MAG: TlpA disulfide reductase family protein [Roseivirga sp.]